jgi:zinc transport system ATP-binding protein
MKPKNKLIEAKGVKVKLGKQEVLSELNFDIVEGAITMIIGPNGAGKTTLMKAILGLVEHSGKIKVNAAVQGKLGYVPQKFDFDRNFPITVSELLEFALIEKVEGKIEAALAEVDMLEHADKKLGELSGGQLQRVLIARAIVNEPKLLFLDEPTAGIDSEGEQTFYEIIRHLNTHHGVTVVLISHEISIVYRYATQVLCLNRKLVCSGDPHDEVTREVLEKLYGKDSQFATHCHHNH